MKFHFFGSLEGDRENYKKIFSVLEKMGHKSVTDHVLTRKIEDVEKETPKESEAYLRKMLRWVNNADFVVAEATCPEVSTGYEIMIAQEKGKPVIVLYENEKKAVPHTLKGLPAEKIQVYGYSADNAVELKKTLKMAVKEAKDQMDVRFNFFVSPKIVHFLDWISKTKKMPRAVYLRRLIESDMKKFKEYQKKA